MLTVYQSHQGFVEMMCAYFPDFSQIGSGVVCEWIFALADRMSNEKNNTANNSTGDATKK